MEQNTDQSLFDMNMDSATQNHLLSVSKWTKFISITGFVTGGLFLILLAALGREFMDKISSLFSFGGTNMASAIIAIIVVVLLLVACWLYFLFRASTLLKKGVQSRDTVQLAEGFKAMRIYFIFSFIMSLLNILSTLQSFY